MGTWPSGRDPNGIVDGSKAFVEWNGTYAYVVLEGREDHTGLNCVDTPCVVPESHVFVLGDNRSSSPDSRHWGFVPVNHVVGKVLESDVPSDIPAWTACLSNPE